MPGPTALQYRLRILNPDGSNMIVITSHRGDTGSPGHGPYLVEPPKGDGATYNPLTGESMLGAYTLKIADWPVGNSQRVMTSQLEDAGFRQQLAYRRAIIEMSLDGGTTWTVLTAGVISLLRLIDAMTYEITVQDPMRAMEQSTIFSPASDVLLKDWFAKWPYRGCLAGGPVMTPGGTSTQGPIRIADLGGWEMKVDSLQTATDTLVPGQPVNYSYYILHPHVVYGPPAWVANEQSNLNDFADQIQQAAAAFQSPSPVDRANDSWSTIADSQLHGYCWTNLTWLIDIGDGNGFVAWKPYPYDQQWLAAATPQGALYIVRFDMAIISKASGNWGIAVMPAAGQSLPIGQYVRVRLVTVIPTDVSPIYLSGTPTNLLAQLWNEVGLPYSLTALQQLAQSMTMLGDTAMTFRITAPMKLPDLVNQIVQPLGIGIRGNDLGQLEVFNGRLGDNNVLPSVLITAADVVDGTTTLPFELDPSLAAKTITFTQSRFTNQLNAPYNHDNSLVDGVVVGTDTLTMINADIAALPYGQLDWRADAMISKAGFSGTDTSGIFWQQYVTTHAQRIFDRFGRGGIAFETTLLRGAAGETLRLGDEALIDLPQIPNHNYRLGDNPQVAARRMQMVRRTVLPEGYAVRFVDSGPNAQPLALVPVLTIAVAPDAPRSVAVITITNAAAINSAGYGARVQWAITNGGAVPATGWSDLVAYAPGKVEGGPIRTPTVTNGRMIYARARCEFMSALPSNWSVPVSVTLSLINPPTGLNVSPVATDGSLALLTWTPGTTAQVDVTDIWLRQAGQTFQYATRIQVLNPGSTQYLIQRLTPGAGYIASVQHRDVRTGDVSAAVDISFLAGGTQRTLSAPVNPVGFAGILNPATGIPGRDGTYGIAVIAAEYPAFLEVDVAIETGVGTGNYGAFVTRAVAPAIGSVQGNWTKAVFVAPNDGLHRMLRARHVFDGCTPSAYCNTVIVLPWTPKPLGPLPTNLILEVTPLPPEIPADAATLYRFQADCIDPFGQATQVAVWALSGTGVSIASGPALQVFSPNDTVWKVALPTSGQGTVTVRGKADDGRTIDSMFTLNNTSTLGGNPLGQGTVAVDANGSWHTSLDLPAGSNSFRYWWSTTTFPSDSDVLNNTAFYENTTNPIKLSDATTDGPQLTFGQSIYLTIIPFTGPTLGSPRFPSIHLVGAYITYQATKTTVYSGATWQATPQNPAQPTTPPSVATSGITSIAFLPAFWASNTSYWGLHTVVPTNVTIIQATVYVSEWVGQPYTSLDGAGFRLLRDGNSLGFVSLTGTGRYYLALNENTGAGLSAHVYGGDLELVNYHLNAGQQPVQIVIVSGMTLTYTMTDPSTNV